MFPVLSKGSLPGKAAPALLRINRLSCNQGALNAFGTRLCRAGTAKHKGLSLTLSWRDSSDDLVHEDASARSTTGA
jgi:hypothetical protein